MKQEKDSKIPESGISFHNGSRVYIPAIEAVGTVIEIDEFSYLVRFMNKKGVLETKFFDSEELIEQPALPFEEVPF